MKLTWIGHSCFKVEKDGFTLVIDPYADDKVPGLKPVREKANMVLCSHGHTDHNCREVIELQDFTENPFIVETIQTYHDEVQGAKRGQNQIFVISDGDNKIAHLGDLGCELEPEQMEMLKDLDVILIPVGGYYTIDGSQAATLIEQINPRIVIPMHYRDDTAGFGFAEISTVDGFIENMDCVKMIPSSELDTAYELAEQVVVMQPANGGTTTWLR